MLKRQTVVVVGAGASCEFGLPAGAELKSRIANVLTKRRGGKEHEFFLDAMREAARKIGCESIRDDADAVSKGVAHASSIDRFLDIHRGQEGMTAAGKLGIAHCIMEAERNSSLYFPSEGQVDFTRKHRISETEHRAPVDTWLGRFVQALQDDVGNDRKRIFDNLSFVTFNYDRCIEFYLRHATQHLFRLPPSEAREIADEVPVDHAYGSLGALGTPEDENDPTHYIPFGSSLTEPYGLPRLVKATFNIQTFTEQAETNRIDRIKDRVSSATQVIFLGCAFHTQNMDILRPVTSKIDNVYGTALGLSKADRAIVINQIHRIGWSQSPGRFYDPSRIQLEDYGAWTLINSYARTIFG